MSKARNILFLQSSSELYGSGKIILQVLNIYRDQGFTPIVVLTGEGDLAEVMEKEGFKVRIQNLGILRRKYVNPKGLINRFQKNYKAYRFLDRLHREFQFELVYSNTLAVIVGAYWAKRNRLTHIWHIHEILLGPSILVRLLSKIMDQSTPFPIVVSEAVKKHWKDKFKVARPEVIYNGISYDDYLLPYANAKSELGLSEEKKVITMVGRINPGKGQLFFLEIAKKILMEFPQVHFLLVGDPFPGYESIHEEMKSVIRENNLQDSISDLGFRKDIPKILAATDVFVLPSILPDSFPTVILEAMASGLPVVATRSGGAEEMVNDGETGYLIPIGDVERGVEAISKLLSDDNLLKSFGEAGRHKVLNEYNFDTFKRKLQNHLWRHLKEN